MIRRFQLGRKSPLFLQTMYVIIWQKFFLCFMCPENVRLTKFGGSEVIKLVKEILGQSNVQAVA